MTPTSRPADPRARGALPSLVVIGAMKCGTSALHEHLDAHRDVAMSRPKELNFFNGAEDPGDVEDDEAWRRGQWHRGIDWYRSQFDSSAPARGESSPGYTSPSFPEVPARMAAVIPDVRLLYLVRDPFRRALSQYAHHRRDGAETRSPEEALLAEDSQYVARSRYAERLQPFLEHFDPEQVHVIVQERLLERPHEQMRAVCQHIGVDPDALPPRALRRRVHEGGPPPPTSPELARCFYARVESDLEMLRELLDDPIEEWASR